MSQENSFSLIVTIVKKGWGDKVVNASKKAGARGGTIMYGRGTGIHENKSLLGLMIEPEKEIVLTIIESEMADKIVGAIKKSIGINEPGYGIGFIVPLKSIFGAQILCPQDCSSEDGK
ncbi:P-II family nitrogen regulator [Methanomethylovorans sp.]|uniref:P-II family nitrogen regulator n=1 Tax=Methanomethylovorans sp. TaxID=2758717 RepID=UPI000AE790D6|nr:P-II family nitrogen regulator [Methanomethylovorans sp.]